MQKPASLSNDSLIHETRRIVREELRIGLEVLEHLREIDGRRLWLERGHSSLFAFCTRELGYSEPQAQLRIDAMRALRDTPAIEAKVRSGALNVSAVVQVQRFLRQEKSKLGKSYSPEARAELFSRVEGKSLREVERELVKISPETARPEERIRALTETESELRLVVSEELRLQLEALKAHYSHRLKNAQSTVELLALLAADALERVERKNGRKDCAPEEAAKARDGGSSEVAPRALVPNSDPDRSIAPIAPKVDTLSGPSLAKASRYIPVAVRRAVFRRDRGECGYVAPKTGRRCGSRVYLQIDHVTPYSRGGSSGDASGLRLRCGAHNRLHWQQWRAKSPARTDGA